MRKDARVCKANKCRQASKRHLSRRWTTAETKRCTVAENGVQCPTKATRRLTTANPMCDKHDIRATRHGDPTMVKVVRRPHGEVQALLHQGAAVTHDVCFLVPGPDGGRVSVSYLSQSMTASRAVWMIANGDPGEAHVLHTCHRGDEGCISIRHLYLGDHEQNMVDMIEADRSNRGERNGKHLLTAEDVRSIRQQHRERSATQAALAVAYDVHPTTISNAISGRNWGWLDS
jgi:hypothetical protein